MLEMLRTVAMHAIKKEDARSFFVAAFGLRRDCVMVKASNSATEHPNPKIHAEARLVRKLGKNAPVVFVARYSYGNQGLAMAKPCPYCEAILKSYGVKQVIYSTGIDSFEKITLT